MSQDDMVDVRFQLNTLSYHNSGRGYLSFEDAKARKAFYREAKDIFLGLGWAASETNVRMDGSSLYIHPREISGTVRRWEVDYIADHLNRAELFSVSEVQLSDTVMTGVIA